MKEHGNCRVFCYFDERTILLALSAYFFWECPNSLKTRRHVKLFETKREFGFLFKRTLKWPHARAIGAKSSTQSKLKTTRRESRIGMATQPLGFQPSVHHCAPPVGACHWKIRTCWPFQVGKLVLNLVEYMRIVFIVGWCLYRIVIPNMMGIIIVHCGNPLSCSIKRKQKLLNTAHMLNSIRWIFVFQNEQPSNCFSPHKATCSYGHYHWSTF